MFLQREGKKCKNVDNVENSVDNCYYEVFSRKNMCITKVRSLSRLDNTSPGKATVAPRRNASAFLCKNFRRKFLLALRYAVAQFPIN